MKKIKTALATLLSLTCLFAATACEGLQFVTMGGNSTSVEESSSKLENPITEAQWEELLAAFEKTMNSGDNFTYERSINQIETSESHWEHIKDKHTIKIAGDLREAKYDNSRKYGEDGEWEYHDSWEIEVYTEELAGVDYRKGEDGWQAGNFSVADRNEFESMLSQEKIEELKEQLEYDKTKKIYYIDEYTMEIDTELVFGAKLKEGVAEERISKLEIQLKDGYILRYYVESIMNVDATLENEEGETEHIVMGLDYKNGLKFTNYGTTKITIPDDIKDEVEELLKNS